MLSNRTLACITLGAALLVGLPKSAHALTLPEIRIPEISVPQISTSTQSTSTKVTTSSNTNIQIITNGEGTTEVTTKETQEPIQEETKTPDQTPQQQSVTTQVTTPTPTPWWYRLLRPTVIKTPTPTPTNTISPTSTDRPSATPSPTSSANPTSSLLDSKQQYMLNAINDYRKRYSLAPVQPDKYTCSFASTRAKEITTNFSHDGFSQRLNAKTLPYPGYSLITENIAMTSNYQNVVNMWINSPGHALNMRKDTPYVCVAYSGNYYAYGGWRP